MDLYFICDKRLHIAYVCAMLRPPDFLRKISSDDGNEISFELINKTSFSTELVTTYSSFLHANVSI